MQKLSILVVVSYYIPVTDEEDNAQKLAFKDKQLLIFIFKLIGSFSILVLHAYEEVVPTSMSITVEETIMTAATNPHVAKAIINC